MFDGKKEVELVLKLIKCYQSRFGFITPKLWSLNKLAKELSPNGVPSGYIKCILKKYIEEGVLKFRKKDEVDLYSLNQKILRAKWKEDIYFQIDDLLFTVIE